MKTLRYRLFLYCGLLFVLFVWSSQYAYAETKTVKIKFINNTECTMYYNLYWLDSGWPGSQYYGPPCVMGGELKAKATFTHDFEYPRGIFVLIWSLPYGLDDKESLDGRRFNFKIDPDNYPSIIRATTKGVLIK